MTSGQTVCGKNTAERSPCTDEDLPKSVLGLPGAWWGGSGSSSAAGGFWGRQLPRGSWQPSPSCRVQFFSPRRPPSPPNLSEHPLIARTSSLLGALINPAHPISTLMEAGLSICSGHFVPLGAYKSPRCTYKLPKWTYKLPKST